MTHPKLLRDMAEGLAIAQLACINDECPDWHAAFLELQDADHGQTKFAYFEPTENYDHLNADEFFPLVEEEADAIHDNLKTAYDMGAAARSHTPINIR